MIVGIISDWSDKAQTAALDDEERVRGGVTRKRKVLPPLGNIVVAGRPGRGNGPPGSRKNNLRPKKFSVEAKIKDLRV